MALTIIQAWVNDLRNRLTSTRAGYLDNLNGLVASRLDTTISSRASGSATTDTLDSKLTELTGALTPSAWTQPDKLPRYAAHNDQAGTTVTGTSTTLTDIFNITGQGVIVMLAASTDGNNINGSLTIDGTAVFSDQFLAGGGTATKYLVGNGGTASSHGCASFIPFHSSARFQLRAQSGASWAGTYIVLYR